jgi:hypothetical protein
MKTTRFDEFTKRLATASSRRQALRTLVTASVSLFGLASIRTAFGNPGGGNSYCAQWCHAVFGGTAAAGHCTSDAAHGTGLCATCGKVDPSSLCCVRDINGFCVGSVVAGCSCDSNQCETCDPSTGTCVSICPAGQHCQSGTCVPNCHIVFQRCTVFSECCSGRCESGMCVPECFDSPCTTQDQCCLGTFCNGHTCLLAS